MDFEPYFKVHNLLILVSVHPKSIILGQMTNLNMIFDVLVSVYRLIKIWNSPQFPDEFRNGQYSNHLLCLVGMQTFPIFLQYQKKDAGNRRHLQYNCRLLIVKCVEVFILLFVFNKNRLYAISAKLSPEQRSSGIEVLEADSFKLHCFQTHTGKKQWQDNHSQTKAFTYSSSPQFQICSLWKKLLYWLSTRILVAMFICEWHSF